MKIERNGNVTPPEINSIRRAIHWEVQPEEKIARAMTLSWGWITARDENAGLTGFVRILSDGIRHAYVLDLIVHPDFQGRGIGTAIMENLMAWLGENHLFPTLVSVPGKEEFYRKFGFNEQDGGKTAMCIRTPFWEGKES